ncbi:MAG: 1-acyl-sn-glycerol-3-phosphate acyltransferase [Treponema sp.]|nr:1-acyl-sn-glycerol-3-phosphate acyltransferase [Treponema sp.]
MGMTLKEKYSAHFAKAIGVSRASATISEDTVYEEANMDARRFMDPLINDNFLPGSGLNKIENFKAFYDEVAHGGKSGLILMEHYTNLDLPAICYLLERTGTDWGKDFSQRIVAVAGMKLNEENHFVRAFAEGFTRVIIYPTRSLEKLDGRTDAEKIDEEKKARKINFAAMHAMNDCKKRGQIILVFPSGTRYRPGRPETKRGLPEIDSYLRLFDLMLPVSINGNCLRINPDAPDDMLMDIVTPDVITLTAHEPIACKPFRTAILDALPANSQNPKQATVDRVMAILAHQHDEVERTHPAP